MPVVLELEVGTELAKVNVLFGRIRVTEVEENSGDVLCMTIMLADVFMRSLVEVRYFS